MSQQKPIRELTLEQFSIVFAMHRQQIGILVNSTAMPSFMQRLIIRSFGASWPAALEMIYGVEDYSCLRLDQMYTISFPLRMSLNDRNRIADLYEKIFTEINHEMAEKVESYNLEPINPSEIQDHENALLALWFGRFKDLVDEIFTNQQAHGQHE